MKTRRQRRTETGVRAPIQIEVLADEPISSQARTYAEYRVFAALTHLGEAQKVRRARVVLRPVSRPDGCQSVTCVVTIAMDGSEAVRVRTTGAHAYAAINRAVERIKTTTAPATTAQFSPDMS
jgi:ribosome-associated translation inhibitor RaiA